jgi:uncharacterized membrane protein YgcG
VRAPRRLTVLLTLLLGTLLVGVGAAPAWAGDDTDEDAPAVVALDAAGAGVDDFEFASFDGVYELSRGDDGRSQLHTVETLVAVFPDFDQNRGIRRALVPDYKGHSTNIHIVSVTDENGTPRSYESAYDDDGFFVLTIAVPQGQFVHGQQTYVIEYTQTDVTATSTDLTDGVTRDEFFWDTNGTGWAQPFGEVTATVRVASALRPSLTGEAYCYYGYEGARDRCEVSTDEGEFTATVRDLTGYQNMTVVVSFEQGTFASAPFWAYVPIPVLLAAALVVFALIFTLITRFVFYRDAPGRGTIIAQYEPPEGLSTLVAANIVGRPTKGMAASIVDLAVQKNLRILEHDQGWSKVFGVQRLSSAGLAPDEARVMGALFSINPFSIGAGVLPGLKNLFQIGGSAPQPIPDPAGEVRWLTKGDTVLGQQVVALTKAVAREVEAGGLRRKPPGWPLAVIVGAFVLAGVMLLGLAVFGGGSEMTVVYSVIGLNAVPWIAILSIGLVARRRPLTTKGSELKEHLLGLREFIRIAEADRLQMLQSVSGAERISTTDGAAIIKIYEKLLPYAVLFGLEKQWAAEIAKYYDTNPPDWYAGSHGFAIGSFAAGLSSLSSSVSTSYSGSSGSSSSGGGGGGGSSGGGGGGGGGGGV